MAFSMGKVKVTNSSTFMVPSKYFCTYCGSCVRPRVPPNAVPCHDLPMTTYVDAIPGRYAVYAGEREKEREREISMR